MQVQIFVQGFFDSSATHRRLGPAWLVPDHRQGREGRREGGGKVVAAGGEPGARRRSVSAWEVLLGRRRMCSR